MTDTLTLTLPIRIEWGVKKKTKYALNINTYRNKHHSVNAKAKLLYHDIIADELKSNTLTIKGQYKIIYTLFVGSKRKCDIANVCAIVDKFLCDSLQTLGIVEEDNYDYLPRVVYQYGGYDKDNERIEVEIKKE